MPLHITVVPASTKAGRETIRALLETEPKVLVRGIYRDTSKAPTEFIDSSNFEAIQGDVGTGKGLDFSHSDAVFYIPPPIYDGTDQGDWANRAATNVKDALKNAPSVKRLLLFSSVGSQYDHSIGILRLNHITDTILKDAVPQVLIIRPGYFQEDFAHLFETAQADPPIIQSWITPADYQVPIVSLKDISECCANALVTESARPSPYYFKLFGPRLYTSIDLKNAVAEVTGRDVELKLVERDQLAEFFGQQLPELYVQDFVDMTTAVLPDGIMAGDYQYDADTVRGRVELAEGLREIYAKRPRQA